MPTPEELVAALAEAKASLETESEVVTDKVEIEAALADTVEELPIDDSLVGLMNRAGELLRNHNGVITDIPRTSEYWSLMNRINALRNP